MQIADNGYISYWVVSNYKDFCQTYEILTEISENSYNLHKMWNTLREKNELRVYNTYSKKTEIIRVR